MKVRRGKDERNAARGARGHLPLFFVIVEKITIPRDDVKTDILCPTGAVAITFCFSFVPEYEVYQTRTPVFPICFIQRGDMSGGVCNMTKPALSFSTYLSAFSSITMNMGQIIDLTRLLLPFPLYPVLIILLC